MFDPWSTNGVIVPFSLRLTSPRRLLLLSVADDPVYADLEVQWVDEPGLRGAGLVLLAVRRCDATTDVQVDERVRLPRADYEVAAGTRSFRRVPFAPARFEVDRGGVDLDLGTTLPDGRAITVRIRERLSGPRWAVDMLAPAGAGMTRPRFFPFFRMGEIGFLRWRGATVEVRVDGTPRRVVRVGVPWRLVCYATAPMTAVWNEAADGPVTDTDDVALTRLAVQRGGQTLSVRHDPAFPDVATMRPGATASGRVSACVNGRAQFGGRWWARRQNESAENRDHPRSTVGSWTAARARPGRVRPAAGVSHLADHVPVAGHRGPVTASTNDQRRLVAHVVAARRLFRAGRVTMLRPFRTQEPCAPASPPGNCAGEAAVQQPALRVPGDHGRIGSRSARPTGSAIARTAGEEASVRAADRAPTIDVVGTGNGVIVSLEEARGPALQPLLDIAVGSASRPGLGRTAVT